MTPTRSPRSTGDEDDVGALVIFLDSRPFEGLPYVWKPGGYKDLETDHEEHCPEWSKLPTGRPGVVIRAFYGAKRSRHLWEILITKSDGTHLRWRMDAKRFKTRWMKVDPL